MITRRELLQYTAATAAAKAVAQVSRAEAQAADAPLFSGFKAAKIKTSGATINLVSGLHTIYRGRELSRVFGGGRDVRITAIDQVYDICGKVHEVVRVWRAEFAVHV